MVSEEKWEELRVGPIMVRAGDSISRRLSLGEEIQGQL